MLCRERCEAHGDCQYASVFAESFDYLNLQHVKPPPPRPPTPPNPPPLPVPPLPPLPPAAPPDGETGIRTFSPSTNEAPTLRENNKFAITCAVDGCGEALPVFESTSQLTVVSLVQDLVASGVYTRSACAYECDHVVSRHALNRDAYTQLLTTSTLVSAQFSYGRLTAAQAGVDDRPGANAGFIDLDRLDQIVDVTMEECDAYMRLRKIIAMHAVWLLQDESLSPATGTCSLFLAARDQHQLTLWQR